MQVFVLLAVLDLVDLLVTIWAGILPVMLDWVLIVLVAIPLFEALIADICDLIPSQTNLLQKLLDLSKTAAIINTARDRNNYFTGNNRETILVQESNLLGDLCEKCEKQLAVIFGPLTTEKA